METLTKVKSCAATACAFNDGGCNAGAVTVGAGAQCATMIELDARGGLPVAGGQVGACQRIECVHNKDLMCAAGEITVSDSASCEYYEVA